MKLKMLSELVCTYLQNLLDPESFKRMMQVLESPIPINNDSFANIVRRMWQLAISNEEYVLNEKTKRYVIVIFCSVLFTMRKKIIENIWGKMPRICNIFEITKGQLNSEWIYEVIVSPKMPTKNWKDLYPTF